MFHIVDTAFSYERELIVCSFLLDFYKGKGGSLQSIFNAHTAFLFCGAELVVGSPSICGGIIILWRSAISAINGHCKQGSGLRLFHVIH